MPAGPRPQIPTFAGPCYDNNCVQFRAQLVASAQAAQAQWDYDFETEKAEKAVSQQKAAYEAEVAGQAKVLSQYEKIFQEAQQNAAVVKKQTKASVAQQKIQNQNAAIQAALTQKQQQPTQRPKKTSQNVGQPGVSRTRVSSRIGIGGYGGTAPGRVNPTGLNI